MGRSLRFGRKSSNNQCQGKLSWWDELAQNARNHGARPYIVEGFTEVTDAVKRGHAVLVRRERAQVSDTVTVFEHELSNDESAVVAILRFDVHTARFVLQDATSSTLSIQLTPRRLARYLDAPERSVGVALGV